MVTEQPDNAAEERERVRAAIFAAAVDILVGPIIENIKNRDEKGCSPSSDKHSEIAKEEESARFHIELNVGHSMELLFSLGLLGGSDEKFKRDLKETAPAGTFHHDRAAFPSVQRQEFRELLVKISALRTCYRRLNWATKNRLTKVSPKGMWDQLGSRLDRADSKVEVAIDDTPNLSGGPVPNEYKWVHVCYCLSMFDAFRPGEASSGERSDFRSYVATIHELATGEREGKCIGNSKRPLSFEGTVKEVLGLER